MKHAAEVVVRVPKEAKPTLCAECSARMSSSGPTSYRGDQPICDRCMFDLSPQLGMVLALISVTRSFGQIPRQVAESSAGELASFSRVYEAFAAKYGLRRDSGLLR